jgi:hypothetical protein
VTKNIQDFIPKLEISQESLSAKSSKQAQIQYRRKIADILQQLVNEYRESLLKTDPDPSGKFNLQTQTPNEEALVNCT